MSQPEQSDEPNDCLDPSDEPRSYPSCLRNGSTSSNNSLGKHRVTFPDNDNELVTVYLEPADPWDITPVTPEDLIELYEESCHKHHTQPLEQVVEQLKTCYQPNPTLEVSGIIHLETLEALEIVLKRVRFSNLRILSRELNDDAAVALFDMLEFYESATTLSLTCESGLGQRSWQACSRMIKKTQGLTELDVRGTPVNEQVMTVLCRPFKVGSKLSSLQLGRCGVSDRALTMLVNALRLNNHLQELTLADNDLKASDAAQLGSLLRENVTLRYLDISNNAIEDAGCASICDALAEQRGEGLQALVMWNTALTSVAATLIAKVLASMSVLETLNIGQNHIGKAGLTEIKSAMIENHRLKLLGVQAAHISCDGAEVIADILRENRTLERLDARSNNIGERGLMALKNALQTGHPLQRLDLDDVPGTCQDIIDEIRKYCQINEAKVLIAEEENQRTSNFSRKISLTCETMMMRTAVEARGLLAEPRKTGRLRSPAPSPIPSPSSSPIPSPSRNRFRVSRVSETNSPGSSSSPISPVVSRFRVTVVEPEPDTPPSSPFKPIVTDPTKVQIGFHPVEPVQPAAQQPQRKVSTTSKPQTSMEKLLGLFQNPASLFSSVANVALSGDKEKNTQSQESAWDWDWSCKDPTAESRTNNNV